MENLVGKLVYSYIAWSSAIKIRVYRITEVYEKDGVTMVVVGNCIHMPLVNIGKTTIFTREWFTFERNDEQARQILYGNAKCAFYNSMQELLKQIDVLKNDYEGMFQTITNGEITKDTYYWGKYNRSEQVIHEKDKLRLWKVQSGEDTWYIIHESAGCSSLVEISYAYGGDELGLVREVIKRGNKVEFTDDATYEEYLDQFPYLEGNEPKNPIYPHCYFDTYEKAKEIWDLLHVGTDM